MAFALLFLPAEKVIEHGRKIAAFRAEKTIAAVKKSIANR
jgi:hypothetical protein